MISKLVLVIMVTAFSFTSVLSQQPGTDEPGCASNEGKQMDFLVGEWNVKSKFRVGPDKWEETVGTSRIKYLFDECLLFEKLNVKRGGRPLTVIATYSYNNISRNYQWSFAHSEHGLLAFFEGPMGNDGFTFRNTLELRGRKILFERLLTKTSQGFELVAKRSFDNGATWRDDWYLSYSRR